MTSTIVQEYRHKLKSSQDYAQARFAWMASALLTLVLLSGSFDFAAGTVRVPVFAAFVVYAVFTAVQIAVTAKIRNDLYRHGTVQKTTRILGYVQMLSIVTGNLFVAMAAFHLVKRHKSAEYTFAVYMVLTGLLVMAASALNLFKPYVADTFPAAMLVLLAVWGFHLIALLLAGKYAREEHVPPRLKYLAWPLLLTALTGNLFALLLGWNLLAKSRKSGAYGAPAAARWEEVWERLARNTTAMLGLFVILVLFSLSVVSPFTFSHSMAMNNNYGAILQPPSLEYPFGTDNFGRCLYSRVVLGARISLAVGVVSTVIPLVAGGVLGAISGYFGRRTDNLIMRLLDILYAIPGFLLAIAIIAAFGANTVNLILALSAGAIPTYARTMRANVLQVSTLEYVQAARALGTGTLTIIFRHIVPNSLAPMIVKSTLTIGTAVISMSSLSFLGLGVEPHIPEWGNILKLGSAYLETHPYLAIYPGLAIMALVLSFNFFGDGLRDALDPKTD